VVACPPSAAPAHTAGGVHERYGNVTIADPLCAARDGALSAHGKSPPGPRQGG
jgi:hypothetical protein